MTAITLTHKQHKLLAYLKARQSDPVGPSFEEMKEAMGLASKSGIFRLVDALVERGYVARIPNRARAIVVLDEPAPPPEALPEHRTVRMLSTEAMVNELKTRGFSFSGKWQ